MREGFALISKSTGRLLVAAAVLAFASGCFAAASAAPVYGSASHGTQGYLGIDVRDVSEENMSGLRLREAHGAEIIRIDHDGPAGKMGLREHDVVLQMNGVAIEGEEHIRRMLRDTAPGHMVTLVISRDGQQITVSAPMADRGEVERQAFERHLVPAAPPSGPQAPANALPLGEGDLVAGPGGTSPPAPQSRYSKSFLGTLLMSPTYTGAMLEAMGPQLAQFFAVPGGAGLLVRSVEANSPAAMAGLRAGDVVVRANAQPVGTPSHWTKTIREAKGRPITVTILRDRQEKSFVLTPDTRHRSSLQPGGGLDGLVLGPNPSVEPY